MFLYQAARKNGSDFAKFNGMARRKIELIDIDQKKEAQVLQDISLTPPERFVRMFDLIEFSIAFSDSPKMPLNKRDCHVITLRKKS